jgi:putative flippase GtrA
METLLKNFGIIILLLGVVCLVVYKFACPSNALLIVSIALEIAGIISYIVINRRRD